MPFRTDRLSEIEHRLAALEKENAALRRRVGLSMREDQTCPRCEHEEVVHAESILDRAHEGRAQLSVIQPSIWSSQTEGEFEVYVCRSCGFVEWYVKQPKGLGRHSKSKDLVKVLKPGP